MLRLISPRLNELMSFSKHALVWIKSGTGLIEVDFKTYTDFDDRLIFLSPGQYIKFVFGEFEVGKIEFPESCVSNSPDFRVLFKHLVSLGYIQFTEGSQQALHSLMGDNLLSILDISTKQWFWQNPFNAQRDEYTIIFDLKDVIDQQFRENPSVEQLVSTINHEHYNVSRLVKNRLGLTVKGLTQKKLLVESQKDIAFTDKPIQEIAQEYGFKDPAYFNRFFKQNTQLTPLEFRSNFGDGTDTFLQDLLHLINQNHKLQHTTSFYADKTHMSIKTLSRKVKEKLNLTVGDLVRNEIINSAKIFLQNLSIKETAFELGFEEPNHFSAFFKKYTGMTPSQYQSKKYNF